MSAFEQQRHPAVDGQEAEDEAAAGAQDLGRQQDDFVEKAAKLHAQDRAGTEFAGPQQTMS